MRTTNGRERGIALRRREDSHRLLQAFSIFIRPRGVEAIYGPASWEPDRVENDYYRFLNAPRD